ncbi:px domain containing protein [Stylonychia lemnae]|uniref:Px domain containing protein n=1 Tax=Stylonychia lemnae TaxID=5949 RepID=A0A078A6Q0_STYLE|nr:px domain containing protein [Stylonychia lemnae]|eukprot:CDW77262.1 px domain containing protein [Stylonychia lemnae]
MQKPGSYLDSQSLASIRHYKHQDSQDQAHNLIDHSNNLQTLMQNTFQVENNALCMAVKMILFKTIDSLRQKIKFLMQQKFNIGNSNKIDLSILKQIFDCLDKNRDNIITITEMQTYLKQNEFRFEEKDLKLLYQLFGKKNGQSITGSFIPGFDLESFGKYFWGVIVREDDVLDLVVSNMMPSFPQYGVSPKNFNSTYQSKQEKSLQRNTGQVRAASQQDFLDFTQNELIKKEWLLKSKLSTYFSTSKQAYLTLKRSRDGLEGDKLKLKDIQSYLQNQENEQNLSDIKFLRQLFKLREMIVNDETEEIEFEPFRRWMGTSLERRENFYFRHDTQENPHFNQIVFQEGANSPKKMMNIHPLQRSSSTQHIRQNRANFNKNLTATSQKNELLNDLIDKIKNKYNTISKAFSEMNYIKESQNAITKQSFGKVLVELGYFLDEETANELYSQFDVDKDGILNKNDFYKVMGQNMMPSIEDFQKIEIPAFDRHRCRDLFCLVKFINLIILQKTVENDEILCQVHQQAAMDYSIDLLQKIRSCFDDDNCWQDFLNTLLNENYTFETLAKLVNPLMRQIQDDIDQIRTDISYLQFTLRSNKQNLIHSALGLNQGSNRLKTSNSRKMTIKHQQFLKHISESARQFNKESLRSSSQNPVSINTIIQKQSLNKQKDISENSALSLILRYYQENQEQLLQLKKLLRKFDNDKTGYIEINHFIDVVKTKIPSFNDTQMEQEFKQQISKFVSQSHISTFNFKLFFDEYLPVNTVIDQAKILNQNLLNTIKQNGSNKKSYFNSSQFKYSLSGLGDTSDTLASKMGSRISGNHTPQNGALTQRIGSDTFRDNYFSTTSLNPLLASQFDSNLLKLRSKLEYEWKNIYKQCLLNDIAKSGYVKVKSLEKIFSSLKVFASNEDLTKLVQIVNTNDENSRYSEINYMKLAELMHLPKLFEGGQTGKYLEKVNLLKQSKAISDNQEQLNKKTNKTLMNWRPQTSLMN